MEIAFQLVISGRGETEEECKKDVADIIYDMTTDQIEAELMFDAIAQAGYSEKDILAVIRLKPKLVEVLKRVQQVLLDRGQPIAGIDKDITDVLDKAQEVKI